MKKAIISTLLILMSQFLFADDSECESEFDLQYIPRTVCYPLRVYALRRFATEGEINYTDISWAGKREDSFYDGLTR